MQVDNPIPFSFDPSAFNTSTFDDFFNLEPSNPSNATSSSSSSPRSPLSFATMPLTPPTLNMPPPITAADDAFFNLFLQDEYATISKLEPPITTATPYDFLSGGGAMSSPESSTSAASPHAQPMFAIDPQLVGTPATSKALSDFDEEEEHEDDQDDDDLEPETEPDLPVPTKRSRKGTVHSGGVKKSTHAATDKEKENSAKSQALRILEPEDWRPSPEEYKKMSSKEKRQLRNKISARNFRVRRKEYITTLEGDIAERDHLISAIRTELGSSKSENVALREEIDALKRCLLQGRGVALPDPAPLPEVSAAITSTVSSTPTSTTTSNSPPAATKAPSYNPHKDLPTSPRLGSRTPFWGGLGSGVTPVHTTLVPPLAVPSVVLAGKASVLGGGSVSSTISSVLGTNSVLANQGEREKQGLQENINPGLLGQKAMVERKGGIPALNPSESNANSPALGGFNINGTQSFNNASGGFDSFAEINPFTLKTLDAYRMQLWGKMAAQQQWQAQLQQQQSQAQSQQQWQGFVQQQQQGGLAGGLRPHYFAPKLGKGATAPASSHSSSASSGKDITAPMPTKEHAYAAALASQTLLGKLGSAFWEAFSGSSGSSSTSVGNGKGKWDSEKVRKVLEGTAVVRVVDVDPVPTAVSATVDVKPIVGAAAKPTVVPDAKPTSRANPSACGMSIAGDACALLEESMRSLTLAKK
ncbi:hypothetical protein BV22DRAFT_1135221 [Leucogyrophana mollusca]|uniref:Uncharacterized protein n=1 Tax=Leucogyrophana mollusca TaxID=85980 RepID=A0ACB8AWV0_9AGAM|nr:hypothetical protein BV22DRAFT_1135221 [Leucogyrophana mollusca]